MTNKLIDETSPYLLQHVDNPVEWYPWNQESLAVARSNEKPILLSIGYAACHWCHVMAHESFEDPETAQFMNEHFVNIKVDREERPDLDSIYMDAVVALTGQGGWPMTVFLTPEGEPFYAGTYFPPTPRFGMPSFRQVLSSVARAWQEKRSEIIESATNLTSYIGRALDLADSKDTISEEILTLAVKAIESNFDPQKGGFGRAPKFPQAMTLEFLLRQYIRTEERNTLHMVEHTLEAMARGGIYDHLGGGFSRYATDNDWLVPHFEKMLYDNALLSRVYLHACRVKERPHYRQVVLETLDWALREMRDPGGGFFSSLDADSEGEEGKYYVWRADEIRDILGEQADLFLNYYGVTGQGNWEGKNILNISASMEGIADISGMSLADAERYISQARKKMYESRERRIRPGRDEKVLTAWNGLMLAALAEAGRDLNRPDLLDAARQNAVFIRQNLRTDSGRLLRTWKAGSGSRYNGYLEDYAFLADGLLALYQSTYEAQWFSWARELADMILRHFYDDERGGFFDTSDDHEALIHRPKSLQDNAIPSGNSMAVNVLLRISLYTGDSRYWDIAEAAVSAMQKAMTKYPTGFAHWLCAADFILGEPLEVALAGNPIASDVQPMIESVFAEYRPNMVVAVGLGEDDIPLLKGRTQIGGKPAAYLCRRFVCDAPITDSQILLDTLA